MQVVNFTSWAALLAKAEGKGVKTPWIRKAFVVADLLFPSSSPQSLCNAFGLNQEKTEFIPKFQKTNFFFLLQLIQQSLGVGGINRKRRMGNRTENH